MNVEYVYSFVNDAWQFFKAHAEVKDTDEYWAKVVADAEVLEQRYGKGNRHMHNIILEVLDALDERGQKK
jgi:hypothetical protein